MSKITKITGRKILDSRGKPTVEVEVVTRSGARGIESVPSGTSRGGREAALVDPEVAINNVNETIGPRILGMDVTEQAEIDRAMLALDGTDDLSHLGANAVLGVSLASSRAAAAVQKKPLYRYLNELFRSLTGLEIPLSIPKAMMVMLCGGMHAAPANHLCIQEFSVIGEVEDGVVLWNKIKKMLIEAKVKAAMGLEGAFSADLETDEDALEFLRQAIEESRDELKAELRLALDVAGNNCRLTNPQIIDYFKKFHLFSIEDPFGEEEWARFGQLKLELEELERPYLLIGDDLFATHKGLLEKGIKQIVANGIIIKPNQVGTLSAVFEVAKIAHKAGFTLVCSHRSGETASSFIADLAVAIGAKYLKAGAPIPSERMLKYHRLKEIAKEI